MEMTESEMALVASEGVEGIPADMHETFLGLDMHAWIAVAFATFVFVLWKAGAFRMTGKWLDGQAEKVRANLAEAAALKAEAEQMRADAAHAADEAKRTAAAMIAQAEKEVERIVAQGLADADAQIARKEKLAAEKLAAGKRTAEAELRGYTSGLILKAAQDILAEKSKAGELADLTDTAIATFGPV